MFSAGAIEGHFLTYVLPELEGALFWDTRVIDLGNAEIYRAQVVPIPGAVWLFASALGLLGWRKRIWVKQ